MENTPSKRPTTPDVSGPSGLSGGKASDSVSESQKQGQTSTQTTPITVSPSLAPAGQISGVEEKTRYQVLRSLGKGGTGEVHEGLLNLDSGDTQPVAIKVLLDNPDEVPGRLRQLIESLQGLSHPHVVLPSSFVASSAGRVVLSPLHRGLSLAEALRRLKRLGRPMPMGLAVQILDETLAGLEFLHGLPTPLVHQSVKPSNIHLGADGVVRLVDVGVLTPMASPANRSKGLAVSLMLPYLAPELLVAENAASSYKPTPASDLYALAASAYEMLAGRSLFDGSTARREMEIKVGFGVQDKVRALEGVYPGMASVLGVGLAVLPKDRPASAQAFRELLAPLKGQGESLSLAELVKELEALPERKTTPGSEASTVAASPMTVLPPQRGTSPTALPARPSTVGAVPARPSTVGAVPARPSTTTALPARGSVNGTSPEAESRKAPTAGPSTPPRVVEQVPEHVLARMSGKPGGDAARPGGTNRVRLGILLGSLVLAAAALWWVDSGNHPRRSTNGHAQSTTTPSNQPTSSEH